MALLFQQSPVGPQESVNTYLVGRCDPEQRDAIREDAVADYPSLSSLRRLLPSFHCPYFSSASPPLPKVFAKAACPVSKVISARDDKAKDLLIHFIGLCVCSGTSVMSESLRPHGL